MKWNCVCEWWFHLFLKLGGCYAWCWRVWKTSELPQDWENVHSMSSPCIWNNWCYSKVGMDHQLVMAHSPMRGLQGTRYLAAQDHCCVGREDGCSSSQDIWGKWHTVVASQLYVSVSYTPHFFHRRHLSGFSISCCFCVALPFKNIRIPACKSWLSLLSAPLNSRILVSPQGAPFVQLM